MGLVIKTLSIEKSANGQKCDLPGPGSIQSAYFEDDVIKFRKPDTAKHLNHTSITLVSCPPHGGPKGVCLCIMAMKREVHILEKMKYMS